MPLQPGPLPAQVFAPPSGEARFLLRHAPWLVSPREGRAGLLARFLLMVMVAPMTQLTFVSFDLQAFLFLVFHRRWAALLGHGVFMTTENLFILAALRGVGPLTTPLGRVDLALAYAALLVVWYAVAARQERLWGWAALMVPVVAGLYALAGPLSVALAAHHLPAWWGIVGSAFVIAISHVPEAALPPRAAHPMRWVSVAAFLREPGLTGLQRLGRLVRLMLYSVWGTVDEMWAAPRLMAYNYLNVMLWLGYRPALARRLRGWADAAWEDGQPALDYVGTGGGTFLSSVAGLAALPPGSGAA